MYYQVSNHQPISFTEMAESKDRTSYNHENNQAAKFKKQLQIDVTDRRKGVIMVNSSCMRSNVLLCELPDAFLELKVTPGHASLFHAISTESNTVMNVVLLFISTIAHQNHTSFPKCAYLHMSYQKV